MMPPVSHQDVLRSPLSGHGSEALAAPGRHQDLDQTWARLNPPIQPVPFPVQTGPPRTETIQPVSVCALRRL